VSSYTRQIYPWLIFTKHSLITLEISKYMRNYFVESASVRLQEYTVLRGALKLVECGYPRDALPTFAGS